MDPTIQHHRRVPPPPPGFVPPSNPTPTQNFQPSYQQPVVNYQQPQYQQPVYQQPAPQAYQPAVNYQQPQYQQNVYQQPTYQQSQPQPQLQAPPPVNRNSQPNFQPSYQPQHVQPQVQPQQPQPQQISYPPPEKKKSQKGWLSSVSSWVGGKEKVKENRQELFTAPTPVTPPVLPSSNAYDPKWSQMKNDSSLQAQHYQTLQVDNTSTNLALEKLNQATDIGLSTLSELEKQSESIDKIEMDVEKIHLQLDRGDRQLKSISGLTGAAKNLVTNDKKSEKQSRLVYAAESNSKDRTIQIQTHHAVTPKLQESGVSQYNHLPPELRAQMEEQDKQLELLSKGLSNLQNIAGTMGTELDRQNAQIAKVNYRVDEATERTHNSYYKMGTMM